MNKDNLANGVILSASGTTITLRPGHGARLPAVPFFATAAPLGELMSKANSEIVQVTAIVGDVLTVVRAQRGTTQKTLEDGWALGNGVYVEDLPVASQLIPAGGTNGQALKRDASGNATWQNDANTTYTEITDAEAANNASSTIRLMTGRRLQKAITDAFTAVTGFIRSATTKRLTVSTTEPTSPETGDIWINPTVGAGDNVLKDDGTFGKVTTNGLDYTTIRAMTNMPSITTTRTMGYGMQTTITRQGNMVMFHGNTTSATYPAVDGLTLSETIPAGYRPWRDGAIISGNVVVGGGVNLSWDVKMNGSMSFFSRNAPGGNTRLTISGMYITNDPWPV